MRQKSFLLYVLMITKIIENVIWYVDGSRAGDINAQSVNMYRKDYKNYHIHIEQYNSSNIIKYNTLALLNYFQSDSSMKINDDHHHILSTTGDTDEPMGMESIIEILLLTIPTVIIMLFTIIGNILVIVSVFTYRPLKNVANMYMVSLAIADITVSVFVMPFNVIYTIRGKWDFGLFFCKGWLTFDILCCTASILNLCAIAIDRYQAIHDPINYARKRTMNRVMFGIIAVWILSALIAMPPLLGWNDWPDEFTPQTPCTLTSEPGFVVYSSSGTFFIPLIIMTIVYFKIYVATKQRLRKRAQQAQDKINLRSVAPPQSSVVMPNSEQGKSGQRTTSLGRILRKKKKDGVLKQLSPMVGTDGNSHVDITVEDISMNPRKSSSTGDECQSPLPDIGECNVDKKRKPSIGQYNSKPITVTINRASDPTDDSGSDEDGNGDIMDKEGKADICSSSRRSIASKRSLINTDDDGGSNEIVIRRKSSSLTQLEDLIPLKVIKCNDPGSRQDNDDQNVTVSPMARKSLLKTPSFGMGQKKKPDMTFRFIRNNKKQSSLRSNKSTKSVHIQITDEGPSVMNIPSGSGSATSSNVTTSICGSNHGSVKELINGNEISNVLSSSPIQSSTLAPGDVNRHSSMSSRGNSSSVSGNYISGNQVSVSSLCPGMRPTTTTMSTTSELTSAASTINTQVSQIWEEKQRISLSRERKAARVLGIVMGVFVLCWLPFFLMYVILPFTGWNLPNGIINLITWLGYINSALNPIIYTIFNQDFRKSFKRILTCESYRRRRRHGITS